MILIRFILINLIIFLIIRSVVRYWNADEPVPRKPEPEKSQKPTSRGVSKKVGEYVDYEEIDK